MSEKKEYVSRPMENGSLHISEDALTETATQAILEVEGVYAITRGVSRKGSGRSVRVVISEDDTVSVDCYVVVLYGHSVVEVARGVQSAVKLAIEAITGSTVSNVNVGISGISQTRTAKK